MLFRSTSHYPQDNATWGGRVFIFPGKTVEPKKKITFGFTVTAPEKPGTYDFQWRMLREGQAWFGEESKNKTIEVVAPEFVPVSAPESVPTTSSESVPESTTSPVSSPLEQPTP